MSPITKSLFNHFRPEDKEQLIANSLIEQILENENELNKSINQDSSKSSSSKITKTVLKELQNDPYV